MNMILIIECIAACIIFGAAIVGSVLKNKTAWLHEYSPDVQKRFLECNPDFVMPEKKKQTVGLVLSKITVCILFAVILAAFAYIAGARDLLTGTAYSYIIWAAVNIFDVFALDIGILAHWKKARLPGTEDMDKEYAANAAKSIRDGIFGFIIGIPASFAAGALILLIV